MILRKLLIFTVALVLSLFTQVQAAPSVESVKAAIVKYSVEMGVDPAITLSIAKVESGFKHDSRSSHGAVGVFQLLPSTARRMGLNPYSLDDNIKGGIMYYKSMYKMFGSMELAIAAYNAGPGNVKKYKSIPPFRETKNFVAKIMSGYYYLKAHTDPSVTAYYAKKSAEKKIQDQKLALEQKTTEQKIVEQSNTVKKSDDAVLNSKLSDVSHQNLPKVELSNQVVANNNLNVTKNIGAPVPRIKSSKSRKFSKKLEEQSVDM